MRNRLECQVRSCRHYTDGLCSLPEIQVGGSGAHSSGNTRCDSFEERPAGSAENAVGSYNLATPDSSIRCAAETCAYNQQRRCNAEWVCVGCSTENVHSKSGTECCTFLPE